MIHILGVLSGSLAGAQEFKEYPSSARAAEQDALASLNDAQSAKARLSEENAALQSRNRELEDEMNALKAVALTEKQARAKNAIEPTGDMLFDRIINAGLVIYYDINVFQIRKGRISTSTIT